SNFKRKIVHFLTDSSDAMALIGRSPYALPEIQGRVLIRLDDVHVAQIYLPVPHNGFDLDYQERVQALVRGIADGCTAPVAQGVRVLPEIVTITDLAEHFQPESRNSVVGFDLETTEPLALDLTIGFHLIAGSAASGKTNLLRLLLAQHQYNPGTLFISDAPSGDLAAWGHSDQVPYLASPATAETFLNALEARAKELAAQREAAGLVGRAFAETTPPTLVLIDDVDAFARYTAAVEARVIPLLNLAVENGIAIIGTSNGAMSTYTGPGTLFKQPQSAIVLGKPEDVSSLVNLGLMQGYRPQINAGFWLKRGTLRKIKLPHCPQIETGLPQ
ncbi:MAG: hypothetical protein FWD83_00645, partial [Promicromonosporaceae bacterium]|nr:hypothetical protein [Promicromonosporaceae bacterium]